MAARLHAGSFALGMGTPTLFLGYLTKTQGVLETLGLTDWLLPVEQASCESSAARLDALWSQRCFRAQNGCCARHNWPCSRGVLCSGWPGIASALIFF